MKAVEPRIGKTYGRLTVVRRVKGVGNFWMTRCSCGCNKKVNGARLVSGDTKSCGCFQRTRLGMRAFKHGKTGTATHNSWKAMLRRCSDPNMQFWEHYGGRGITVCERWKVFNNFFADMGLRPQGMTIERVDNNGNYEPSNCKWGTDAEQARNSRNAKLNSEAVKVLRFMVKKGINKTLLRRLFNISQPTMYKAVNGKSWAND